MIREHQDGFTPRKITTDDMFALRMAMEKYREGQKKMRCVFVSPEKVLMEELWFCVRESSGREERSTKYDSGEIKKRNER